MEARSLIAVRSGTVRFRLRQDHLRLVLGWAVLCAYSLFLAYRAHRHSAGGEAVNPLAWEREGVRQVVAWFGELVLQGFCEVACFVPVGFVAVMVVSRRSDGCRRISTGLPLLTAGIMCAVLTYTVKLVGSGHPVRAVDLAVPALGCLLGVWMGTTWRRGWRARLWFPMKAVLLALVVVVGIGVLVWWSLEETPLPLETTRVTSAEKRRLVDLARTKSPHSLQAGQTHTLRLTEHDLNLLLSWGLSLELPKWKAMVRLDRDCASLFVSGAAPFRTRKRRYLNLTINGSGGIEDGILRLRPERCRIGFVEVPPGLLHATGSFVASLLSRDRQAKVLVDAVKRMALEPDGVQLTYGPLDLPAAARARPFGLAVTSPELLISTRIQVAHLPLLFTAGALPDLSPSLNLCLKTAFALARNRSARRSPVLENQAAILALGILLGHPAVEGFVGSVVADRDRDIAPLALNQAVVRGRSDWVRHFCVSAAITILADKAVSEAAGLLKEELDAEVGGGGFSFADLLADRAGTVFALTATRDVATARALQDRLAGGFPIEVVFPSVEDLPEGIPDSEFQSSYGGVGGEGYRRLVEEIERRVAVCAAYR